MSTSVESSHEEPIPIKRLRHCLVASVLVSGGLSLALLMLAVFFSSGIVLAFSAAFLMLMLLYVGARRLAGRNQIEAAVMMVCIGLWSIALVSAFVVPAAFPTIAITAVLPVFIGLSFVGKPALLGLITGSSLVSILISVLSLRGEPPSLTVLPDWFISATNAIGVPIASSLIFLLVWHYRSRLSEILAATQAANAALRESEEQLAAQVIESQRLAQRSQLLNQLASQIRNSLDLDTILETVVQEIRNVLHIDRCHFVWYRPHALAPSWDVVKEAVNDDLPSFLGDYPLDWSSPMVQQILNLEMLWVDDVSRLSEPIMREGLTAIGVSSLLSLPIQMDSGDIGVVACMHHRCVRPWSNTEVELLQAVILQLAIAINQAELYHQSRRTAEEAQAQAAQLEAALCELQRTQAQLLHSEKMSSLGQLVAGVAHEINNPINFISGNLCHAEAYASELLELVRLYQQTLPDPSPEIKIRSEAIDLEFLVSDFPQLLGSLRVGADRIREIVRSLRTFSRLDEAEMKTVDIHTGLDSTLMLLQNRLKGNSEHPIVEVIKEYGTLPPVQCFPGQLNQVFMNLLTNALDALEERGVGSENNLSTPSPCIRISTAIVEGNRIAISIADNGLGMTEEVHSQLFNPFFTTKPVGKGTGLGLAICHSIVVEKHKGQLQFVSAPGQGTEFVVEIPIRQ